MNKRFYKSLFPLIIVLASGHSKAEAIDVKKIAELSHCSREQYGEPILYNDNMRFGLSQQVIKDLYTTYYNSDSRLEYRAYYDRSINGFVLPTPSMMSGGDIVMPVNFVRNIQGHIESAMSLGVAEYVSPLDMGAAKFLIPNERAQELDTRYPFTYGWTSAYVQDLLAMPDLKILYNTAMHYSFDSLSGNSKDKNYLNFRKKFRNLLASNDGTGVIGFLKGEVDIYNTARELPNHKTHSAAVVLSANKKGCFFYENKGQRIYFDISRIDPGMSPELLAIELNRE